MTALTATWLEEAAKAVAGRSTLTSSDVDMVLYHTTVTKANASRLECFQGEEHKDILDSILRMAEWRTYSIFMSESKTHGFLYIAKRTASENELCIITASLGDFA